MYIVLLKISEGFLFDILTPSRYTSPRSIRQEKRIQKGKVMVEKRHLIFTIEHVHFP